MNGTMRRNWYATGQLPPVQPHLSPEAHLLREEQLGCFFDLVYCSRVNEEPNRDPVGALDLLRRGQKGRNKRAHGLEVGVSILL